jgi:hypothetical protein
MRTLPIVLMLAGCVVGCSRERAPRRERDVALRPQLTDATQHDLAREIDQADRRGTWREVKTRWQGQRMTWTVTRQRVLCEAPAACNVAAFPIQRPAQHGWLPSLEMTATEFGKVETSCGTAEQCELVIEGTLSELALSPEMPTNVRFADVKVVSARKS